ncbi:hypothetical protein WJX72_010834 [[Myrmecia] bisecta]|uniref:Major facilitator superfamily (MFS) profile domain-containing protein n=1 Tax=[Myrmecia] bisecta TaxID=41462 RepID=A0AAW1R9T2_9CHLO
MKADDQAALERHSPTAVELQHVSSNSLEQPFGPLLSTDEEASAPVGSAGRSTMQRPLSNLQRWYMVVMFCLTASLLSADQNLMAPNLSRIADDFHFDADQRDTLLGGVISAAFFLVGAPAALFVGYLSDHVDRKNLLFLVVLLGEGPCLATYWVRSYWQLLVLRLLTGISLGGTFPLVFSLLGDMFSVKQRSSVAAGVQIAIGAGLALGQGIAGFVGPPLGWRWPFVIVAAPTIALATLMVLITSDPPRGAMEQALQEQYAHVKDFAYEERMDMAKLRKLCKIRSNICVILQGLPGSLPWGVLLTYFNDFLSQQKGLSTADATFVLTIWGAGGGAGVVGGGAFGQLLHNWNPPYMPVFVGSCVALGTLPMYWLINADLLAQPLGLVFLAGFAGGALASVAGPNVRAVLLDVNEPETRGVALALQTVLDDLGRGLGPAFVSGMIRIWGRTTAFNAAMAGWLPCEPAASLDHLLPLLGKLHVLRALVDLGYLSNLVTLAPVCLLQRLVDYKHSMPQPEKVLIVEREAYASQLQELNREIRLLEVAAAELSAVKPGKAVYAQRTQLFFLDDKEAVQKRIAEKLKSCREARDAIEASKSP